MRATRTNFELDIERDRELMKSFKQVMTSNDSISLEEALQKVAKSPSSRFWVSQRRAWILIQKMLKGKNPHIEFRCKKAMYDEIYRRVLAYRSEHKKTPMTKIVGEVIRQPAPEFYLSPRSIADIIYKTRQREKAKRRKLFGLFTMRCKKDPDFEKLEEYVEGSGGHID